jgi:hypothetical protein
MRTLIVATMLGCASVAPEEAKPDVGVDTGAVDTRPSEVSSPLAAPREQTFAEVTRDRDLPDRYSLMVEVYPRSSPTCAPAADVSPDSVHLIVLDRWDGSAGVFPLGEETPHGRARMAAGREGMARGTFTIEAFASKPMFVSYDTDVAGKGVLDISRCAKFEAL